MPNSGKYRTAIAIFHDIMPQNKSNSLDIRSLVLSYYLPALLWAFANSLIAPIFPIYVRDYGVSYVIVGMVLSAAATGTLAFELPGSVVMRRLGRKKTMLAGAALSSLSTAALFWVRDIHLLIMLRLVTGAGSALFMLARHAYITTAVPTARRGRAIAALGGANRIGVFLGPAVGGLIAAQFSFRAVFLVCATLQLFVLLLVLSWLKDQSIKKRPSREQWTHIGRTLRDSWEVIAPATLGRIFAIVIRRGRGIIIPLFASEVLGLDIAQIGIIVTAGAALDMLLFAPAGFVMDHFGRRWAIVPCFTIMAVGMFLLPFTTGFTSLLAVSALLGLGNGLGSGTMMTLGADLAPWGARGEFIAVWRFTGDAGGILSPTVIGFIAQAFSLPVAGFALAMAGIAAASIFGLLVRETLVTEQA